MCTTGRRSQINSLRFSEELEEWADGPDFDADLYDDDDQQVHVQLCCITGKLIAIAL